MSIDPRTDEDLIAAVQRKDVSALEAFYDRHRVVSYSLALRTLGNPTDAEDVVQESFLNAWRSSATYQPGRSSPRSWLLTIVHHRSIDKLRGRQSRPQQSALEEGLEIADRMDVWQEVSETLTGEDVRRALRNLPDEQRTTIELAYFEGYTHSEIARVTGVPLGTVKGRMRIGLHKLKSLLESSQTGMAFD